MKFYDRQKELQLLDNNWNISKEHGYLTVMLGRRRVGKTTLLTRSAADGRPLLYLYVSNDNERILVKKFQAAATQTIGLQIFGQMENFADFFEQLMIFGAEHHYTLVIDEFQNFLRVNRSIPSHVQDVWDRWHQKSKVNLIVCGSIFSMMHRIFDNGDEPLYGRQDCRINLLPFRTSVLKEILADYNPQYVPEDLLCLYMLTGGVAKYVAWLMDAGAVTRDQMLEWATRQGSPFLSEGSELLMSEFGKEYANYLSILEIIASGMTLQSQIDGALGKNTGAYLNNLESDYNYIHRHQTLFGRQGGRNQKWRIDDCFLRFWFRFIASHQSLVETERNDLLLEIVRRDYDQYCGLVLEQYFRQKFREEGRFTTVGSYWDRKGENEIDLVALSDLDNTAVIAEVKHNPKRFSHSDLQRKVDSIKKELGKYDVTLRCLSMADM